MLKNDFFCHFLLSADVPQNTYIQGMTEIKLGFTLNLQCDTVANPHPKIYYWYFKPEHKQQFLLLSNMNQVYGIEKVAVSNAGVYMCSAENDIGTGANSSEANVLVYCKYSFFVCFYSAMFKACEISP